MYSLVDRDPETKTFETRVPRATCPLHLTPVVGAPYVGGATRPKVPSSLYVDLSRLLKNIDTPTRPSLTLIGHTTSEESGYSQKIFIKTLFIFGISIFTEGGFFFRVAKCVYLYESLCLVTPTALWRRNNGVKDSRCGVKEDFVGVGVKLRLPEVRKDPSK